MRLLACLLLCSIVLLAPAVRSDDTVNLKNPAVTPGESAAQCYADATEHLRKGMWYERAATQLKEAVRQDPKNSEYHLALGCAYADRAASIGYAASFAANHADEVAQYAKNLVDWQKAQSDPTNDQYHTDKPIPPPAFTAYTKDDLRLLSLTPNQSNERLQELSKDALAEWAQAITLCKDSSERAHAEYVQGWGINLLSGYRYGEKSVQVWSINETLTALAGIPTLDDSAKAFKAAIHDDPNKAIYWQSLGDTLGPPDTDAPDSSDASANQVDPNTHDIPSLAAYRQALKLDPKNALLWWYIAQFEIRTDPQKAVDDLKQAIAADSTNAYPMYVLAQSYLKQTRYINNYRENSDVDAKDFVATENVDKQMATTLTDQDRQMAADAIQLVEQGNGAPFCHYPVYQPPVPDLLSPAYDYMYKYAFLFPGYAEQRALARDLCGYTDVAALNGDLTTAFDVDRDIINMGKKVVGDWSMQEDWKNGQVLIGELVGIAIANIGYADMVRIAQHYGDSGMAEAAQEESDAFKDQATQWKQILRQSDFVDQDLYANY